MTIGRGLGAALILALVAGGAPESAQAQSPPADAAGAPAKDESLDASVVKMNAYVALLNRSLRAVQSLDRYKSWVNMRTGPTGRESIIYGLYQVYDTSHESEKAAAALTQEPRLPELDAAMRDYIAANAALGPILNEASAYYEREDYKTDGMAGGKALHARILAAAAPFLAARARADAAFRDEKAKVDERQLAAIEQREGRGANWHVVDVMIRARRVIDLLPSGANPVIDVAPFDASIAAYASAVKDMDAYGATHPNAFFVFESQPRSLLGKLRDFQEKIDRARGDARRAGGGDLTWIVNDYNMMVTTSQTATQFNH
jgi:hypothetical protein